MKYTILLDPGHGVNTPGKRSPKLDDGSRFYEWEYSRSLAKKIDELKKDLNVVILVPEDEDISLTERANRANRYIDEHRDEKCVLYSLHGNAAGNGEWMNARGWEAWTTKGNTNSDILAEHLYDIIIEKFPGFNVRMDKSDGDKDFENNWTVIFKSKCPSVLTENLFYDNKEDLELMMNENVQYAIAEAHIGAARRYFGI